MQTIIDNGLDRVLSLISTLRGGLSKFRFVPVHPGLCRRLSAADVWRRFVVQADAKHSSTLMTADRRIQRHLAVIASLQPASNISVFIIYFYFILIFYSLFGVI